jgi:fatty-acid desaturase
MIDFTNKRFFYLVLISHISFFLVLIYGSFLQIFLTVLLFAIITLFSSTILYHRYISHRSWNCPEWYRVIFSIVGIFSFTGTPITRTLAHRNHHRYADTEKDSHSPKHLGILGTYFPMLHEKKLNPIMVRDLLHDKLYAFIHRYYLTIIIATVLVSLLVLGPLWTLTLFLAPGALCWNNISICNIFCHYKEITQSRFLAILTFGEGYHKHHHDFPDDPNFGGNRFEIGYFVIKVIEKYGRRI